MNTDKSRVGSNFVCINCGKPAGKLYLCYSSTVLRLSQCAYCSNAVDKYVEYDTSIVLLDLFLQKLEAYRSILFNYNISKIWRITLIFLLFDAYYKWISEDSAQSVYDLEWNFYKSVVKSCLENGSFLLLCGFMTRIFGETTLDSIRFFSLLSVSFYGVVFNVAAVIWDQHKSRSFHGLTNLFLLISHIRALQALSNFDTWSAFLVCSIAFLLAKLFVHFIVF